MPFPRRKALIVSASVGAGHDAVARAYATSLREKGFSVSVKDYVSAAPFLARLVLRYWYVPQVQNAPDNFTWMINMLQRRTWVWYVIGGTAMLSSPGILRWVSQEGDVDIVISTYPLASQALGLLRYLGWLRVPVVTHMCDPGLVLLWFHHGVDLHVGTVQYTMNHAKRLGYRCQVVEPTVLPRLRKKFSSQERIVLRGKLGLKTSDIAVLVSSGSLGLGNIVETVLASLSHPQAVAVVLCGRNRELWNHVKNYDRVIALNWRNNIEEIYAAGDVLVHNTSYMVEEARALGIPVVTYMPLPGHGLFNAEALREAKISEWPTNPAELAESIDRAYRRGTAVQEKTLDANSEAFPTCGDIVQKLLTNRPSEVWVVPSPVAITILQVACILASAFLYIISLPGWLPVLILIRLQPFSAYVFHCRKLILIICLAVSTALGNVAAQVDSLRGLEPFSSLHVLQVLAQYLLGIKFHVLSKESLPKGPAVFIFNHQSKLDILILGTLINNYGRGCIIGGSETIKNCLPLRWLIACNNAHQRGKRPSLAAFTRPFQSTLSTVIEDLKSGRIVFMFPEARPSHFERPELLPFQPGAFEIALETGTPIVPVVIENYSHLYNPRTSRFTAEVIRAKVLPPVSMSAIATGGVRDSKHISEVANSIRKTMMAALQDISRPE